VNFDFQKVKGVIWVYIMLDGKVCMMQ